jgi:hypothetical protein
MKLDSLKKRLAALEPDGDICPRCQKAATMSEEELDVELARLNEILQAAIGNEIG